MACHYMISGYVLFLVLGFTSHEHYCQGQMLTYTPIDNFAVSIKAKYFEQILSSKQPVWTVDVHRNPKYKPKIFLQTIRRFLLNFDFQNASDPSYHQLVRICQGTAEYNKKLEPNNTSNHLELWISIVPQGDIRIQIEMITSVIQKTNTEFNGTVAVFILNYRSLRLGLQTLPLVKHDIRVSKPIIARTPNVSFGLILDGRNCYGSDEYFRDLLKTQVIDTVLFMTQTEAEIDESRFIDAALASPCMFRAFISSNILKMRPPNVGVRLPNLAQFNVKNMTITYNRANLESGFYVIPNPIKLIPILDVKVVGLKPNISIDPVMKTIHTTEEWLRSEPKFSSEFTGIVVHTDYGQFSAENVVPLIQTTFNKILVQKRQLENYNLNSFEQVVDLISGFTEDENVKSELKGRRDRSTLQLYLGGHRIKNAGILQLENVNNSLLSNLTQIAKAVDDKNTSIVLTQLFEWHLCYGVSSNCYKNFHLEVLNQELKLNVRFLVKVLQIQNSLIEDAQFSRRPKIGIILDHQFCFMFYRQVLDYGFKQKRAGLESLKTFIFRIYVHKQTIIDDGALKASTEVIPNLYRCKALIEMYALTVNLQVDFAFNVVVYGCDATSPSLKELKDVARFWELMSQWAVSINTAVFISSAVENTLTESIEGLQNCTFSDAILSLERCDCGWWRVLPEAKARSSSSSYSSLQDRKSAALQMFEKIYHPKVLVKPRIIDTANQSDIILKILIPAAALVLLIVAISIFLVVRYRRKHMASFKKAEIFFKGQSPKVHEADASGLEASNPAHAQSYLRKYYEISSPNFQIHSKKLGSGAFGTVWRATIQRDGVDVDVAVKVFKRRGGDKAHGDFLALKGLISEVKILSYVGSHQHIVKLIGAHTKKIKSGKLFVFLELCELGSVFTFLRNVQVRRSLQQNTTPNDYDGIELDAVSISGNVLTSELSDDMHRWSREIALGMEFLSSKKMVHADLATRNVLLNSEKCAKIADFGLSRRLYDYSEYMKSEAGPLPWRRMSPESLRRQVFNEKTDVWAFGITLWEIFSLADEPYPGLSWDVNFPQMLEGGLRLPKPKYNERQVYSIMKRCWSLDQDDRPSFEELVSILPGPNDYISII